MKWDYYEHENVFAYFLLTKLGTHARVRVRVSASVFCSICAEHILISVRGNMWKCIVLNKFSMHILMGQNGLKHIFNEFRQIVMNVCTNLVAEFCTYLVGKMRTCAGIHAKPNIT